MVVLDSQPSEVGDQIRKISESKICEFCRGDGLIGIEIGEYEYCSDCSGRGYKVMIYGNDPYRSAKL